MQRNLTIYRLTPGQPLSCPVLCSQDIFMPLPSFFLPLQLDFPSVSTESCLTHTRRPMPMSRPYGMANLSRYETAPLGSPSVSFLSHSSFTVLLQGASCSLALTMAFPVHQPCRLPVSYHRRSAGSLVVIKTHHNGPNLPF